MMPNQMPVSMLNMLNQFKANPMQFLLQRRLNIPAGVSVNNPGEILNYLLSSGQVSQEQVNNAYQMAQRFR